MDHYFSRDAGPPADPQRTTVRLGSEPLALWTARGVFSWRSLDRGTELLIAALEVAPGERILDLGCGYGPLAVYVSRHEPTAEVIATDVNPRAVELAARNLEQYGRSAWSCLLADALAPFGDAPLDVIATNPPIRAGWRVVFPMVDDAPRVLRPGGRFYAVARTRQGADTLMKRIAGAFGNCEIVRRGSGYKVMRAVR